MRLIRKILIWGTVIILIGVAVYWMGYLIISNQWKAEYNALEMTEWTDKIKSTPMLPSNFMKVQETIYPYDSESKVNEFYSEIVWKYLSGHAARREQIGTPFSYEVAGLFLTKSNFGDYSLFDKQLILAFGIDEKATPVETMNYYYHAKPFIFTINQKDTLIQLTGIEELSLLYHEKSISELEDQEILELLVTAYPSSKSFDKFSDPELFQKRLDVYRSMYNRKRNKNAPQQRI